MAKIKILAVFLVVCIVFAGAFGIYKIVNGIDWSSDGSSSSGGGSSGGGDVGTDTSVSTDTDGGIITYKPVLQLGDEGLDPIYIVNGDKGEVLFGFIFEGLKENTRYRMYWNINPSFEDETVANIPLTNIGGSLTPCIYLNTSYEVNEVPFADRLVSNTMEHLLSGDDGRGYEFTTETSDDAHVVFFFNAEFESVEQADVLVKTLANYVTELSFVEVE